MQSCSIESGFMMVHAWAKTRILALTDFSVLPLVKRKGEEHTEKYLLKTADGLEVEMVSLPMKAGCTLCISSQVGCRMGCAFCETGKMGLLRSLTLDEIVSQVYQAKHGLGLDVRNVVFMGMGEPFDNYEAVMGAVRILTDEQGFALGPSRITISTSGLVEQIYRFSEGIPRLINVVCDNALLLGFVKEAPRITGPMAGQVIGDMVPRFNSHLGADAAPEAPLSLARNY